MTDVSLALEGSTYGGSVALLSGGRVIAERTLADMGIPSKDGREERVLPSVAECLDESGIRVSEITRVVCGAGPGSFTSLRISASVAKGIAVGVGCPMYAVSSLLLSVASVRQSLTEGLYLSVLPAMRGDCFALLVRVGDERYHRGAGRCVDNQRVGLVTFRQRAVCSAGRTRPGNRRPASRACGGPLAGADHRCGSRTDCNMGARLWPARRSSGEVGGGSRPASGCGRLNAAVKVPAIIRPASSGDIAAVAGIERASFGDPWSEAAFRELLQMRDAIFLVATRRAPEVIAGYVIARVVAGEADVLNLAVSPDDRGRGLGGELLDAGLSAVMERKVREVFLEVRESNVAALALYGSRSFTPVSRRSRYYRNPVEDALLLGARLKDNDGGFSFGGRPQRRFTIVGEHRNPRREAS